MPFVAEPHKCMADAERIRVEVAYAAPERQLLIEVDVAAGATAAMAVRASGILRSLPTLSLRRAELGIFGRRVDHDWVLSPGDRVEIYRALRLDPKESRRLRAQRANPRRTPPTR